MFSEVDRTRPAVYADVVAAADDAVFALAERLILIHVQLAETNHPYLVELRYRHGSAAVIRFSTAVVAMAAVVGMQGRLGRRPRA